jgi:acyl-CoA thioesterase FadM
MRISFFIHFSLFLLKNKLAFVKTKIVFYEKNFVNAMTRIKINLPHNFLYETTLKVQISNVNYGNHLGHDSLISLIHEARMQFLYNYELNETDIDGVGFVVSDLAIQYKNEAFYGDKLLFEIAVKEENKKRCTIFYKVSDIKKEHEVARCQTGIVFFDFKERTSTEIPKKFKKIFFS